MLADLRPVHLPRGDVRSAELLRKLPGHLQYHVPDAVGGRVPWMPRAGRLVRPVRGSLSLSLSRRRGGLDMGTVAGRLRLSAADRLLLGSLRRSGAWGAVYLATQAGGGGLGLLLPAGPPGGGRPPGGGGGGGAGAPASLLRGPRRRPRG